MNTHTPTPAAETAAADSRVRALTHELRIAIRILNREVSDLILADSGPAPAWTDFDRVYLNRATLPADVKTPEEIAVFVGAALHELGHTLFSPRPSSPMWERLADMDRVTDPGILGTLNLAEDQRQERAIIGRFSPTRGYLSAVAVRLILGSGHAGTSWPLIAGRTWIPAAARAASRDAWVAEYGSESAAEVARLIGAFQNLTDPAETEAAEAVDLIAELHRLLHGTSAPSGGCGADPERRGGESIPTPEGGPQTAADADAELTEGDSEGEGAEGEGETEEGDPAEGDSEGDSETEGETSAKGDPTEDNDTAEGEGEGKGEGETEGDSEEGDPSGDPSGTAKGDPADTDSEGEGDPASGPSPEAVADALSEAVAEVLSAEDVREELRDYSDAVNRATGGSDLPERARDRGFRNDQSADLAAVAETLAETLGAMRSESESEWHRGTDSGRVNVGRLFDPSGAIDPGSLFDRYSPDSLADTSVEAVLLVDVSGSMWHAEGRLSEAVHAVHVAADRAEVALTVIGFGEGTHTLIEAGERPSGVRSIECRENYTRPLAALGAALDILRNSDAGNRVALILSDGDWQKSQRADSEAVISAMRAEGVETLSAFYETSPVLAADLPRMRDRYAHGAESFAAMDNLSVLVDLFGEAVGRLMQEGGRR